jgi:RluA family pseudouridine synthase
MERISLNRDPLLYKIIYDVYGGRLASESNLNFKIIEKPYGLSVHNDEPGKENFLQVLQKQLQIDQIFPVNRLDKETSGLMVVAFNSEAAKELAELFQNRKVIKKYQAVLRGDVRGEIKAEIATGTNDDLNASLGTWNFPISDKAEGRVNPAGLAQNRKAATTHFKVLQKTKHNTLVELTLETGLQHQIRKHAALAGHPIVGDPRYNDKKYNDMISKRYGTDRMFLHSCELSFSLKGEDYFKLSSLPKDFESFFK